MQIKLASVVSKIMTLWPVKLNSNSVVVLRFGVHAPLGSYILSPP